MNSTRWFMLVTAAALAPGSLAAQSQGFEPDDDGETSTWSFLLEAGVEREPAYTGSDQFAAEAEFNLEASYLAIAKHERSALCVDRGNRSTKQFLKCISIPPQRR